MRINKWLAERTNLSRRRADDAIVAGRVTLDGRAAEPGDSVTPESTVTLDARPILNKPAAPKILLLLNKPVGYVCSRRGQGSKTIYELLPPRLHYLNPVGRLDKESSGLLLLTNDGALANQLMHPRHGKKKVYQLSLDKPLSPEDKNKIVQGIKLEDGLSRLELFGNGRNWTITMQEGRNRQIRRTFEALNYKVTKLHRTQFGEYKLQALKSGLFRAV